jgi:hypothetical protein
MAAGPPVTKWTFLFAKVEVDGQVWSADPNAPVYGGEMHLLVDPGFRHLTEAVASNEGMALMMKGETYPDDICFRSSPNPHVTTNIIEPCVPALRGGNLDNATLAVVAPLYSGATWADRGGGGTVVAETMKYEVAGSIEIHVPMSFSCSPPTIRAGTPVDVTVIAKSAQTMGYTETIVENNTGRPADAIRTVSFRDSGWLVASASVHSLGRSDDDLATQRAAFQAKYSIQHDNNERPVPGLRVLAKGVEVGVTGTPFRYQFDGTWKDVVVPGPSGKPLHARLWVPDVGSLDVYDGDHLLTSVVLRFAPPPHR